MLRCPRCGGPVTRQTATDCDCSGPFEDVWFTCRSCGQVLEPEELLRDGIELVPGLPPEK